jgi:hypothetical protein
MKVSVQWRGLTVHGTVEKIVRPDGVVWYVHAIWASGPLYWRLDHPPRWTITLGLVELDGQDGYGSTEDAIRELVASARRKGLSIFPEGIAIVADAKLYAEAVGLWLRHYHADLCPLLEAEARVRDLEKTADG